ncbi:jg17319 [Pararge aegeria aegeria]|uniref:Jg17319 protein n=1 Tax=Pararge aegeria aegeria TaxID=348720 RepID=A0A8S4SP72_9NEOP|nr:jg17319 [Pararge aegeria aegeria]
MSQRRSGPTKWVWCVLVLSSGPVWRPVSSISARTPDKIPSTIETQAKFFQDFFSVQLSPYKIEFGHVCEDPNTWEQRYEKKDFKNHRDMGKVRWGDKKGGYGEHYWDLNHAGHTGNQENDDDYDDGSYNEEIQDYPETAEQSEKYEAEEYNPDASDYEKSARPKRENSNFEIQTLKGERKYKEERRPVKKRSNVDETKFKRHITESQNDYNRDLVKINPKTKSLKQLHEQYLEDIHYTNEKNHLVLVPDQNLKESYEDKASKRFIPYEVGAGRKHSQQIASAPVLRLILESSTGRVIDRATGQAYVLEPVNLNYNYS